jgi:hypothetical protein
MTDVKTHYADLEKKCNEIQSESLNPGRISTISESHSAIFDYTNWLEVLKDRPEYSILKMAIREYQMAILSNTLGLYNQAFVGLRFFFERTLIAIQFSSKEIDLRLWQRGERDTYWQEIIDENNGVFAHSFCRAFFPDLKDEIVHYRRIAQKVYRECSEYVHGNLSVQEKIPETLIFDEFLFNEWHNKAKIIKRVILFSYCLRYLKDIKSDKIGTIEETIREEFGHLEMIRDVINLIKQQ